MFYFLSKKGKRSELERCFFEKIIEVVERDHCILTVQSNSWNFPFLTSFPCRAKQDDLFADHRLHGADAAVHELD